MSFSLMQVTFAIYLIVIFALGWAAWKQTKTHQDYLLGGRRLHTIVTLTHCYLYSLKHDALESILLQVRWEAAAAAPSLAPSTSDLTTCAYT